MHPNRAFEWADLTAMLAFVRERAFAHIFAAGQGKLYLAHAPLLVTKDGTIRFHLFRSNRAQAAFEGNRLLISVTALDGYHSANWYASVDQVPTWHYQAVEIEGVARRLSGEELTDLLDRLSAEFEGRFSPDAPWSRSKMSPGKFEAALRALVGFEVVPDNVHGTRKFNQHKSAADIEANVRGLNAAGRADLAEAVAGHWPGR